MNKLFNDEPSSIFHFASPPSNSNNIDRQQQAVHDNISFLASMATASTPTTPESPWQTTNAPHPAASASLDPNNGLQRKMSAMMLRKQQQQQQQQHMVCSQGLASKTNGPIIHDFTQNLNELCYKGFDELNALIQEQRWVRAVQVHSLVLHSWQSSKIARLLWASVLCAHQLVRLGPKLCEPKFQFGPVAHFSDFHFQWLQLLFITRAHCS